MNAAAAALMHEDVEVAVPLRHRLEQAIQGQSAHALEVDETERGLLPRTVDEIRRLLHQFAAGFVHPAPAELEAALEALVQRLDELSEAAPAAQPPEEASAWP